MDGTPIEPMTVKRNASNPVLLSLLISLCLFQTGLAADFPSVFPEAWKTNSMREKVAQELAPGVNYYHYHFDNLEGQPVSVYYVLVDWEQAHAKLKLSQVDRAVRTVADQVAGKHPIAAINGAYFKWKSEATGKVSPYYPIKVDGTLHLPDDSYDVASAIVFNENAFPNIVKQDEIESYDNAMMGYTVWKDGKFTLGGENHTYVLSGQTPHTGVGINAETGLVAFMVVDGRFKDQAPGTNLFGVGYLLAAVGCTDVVSIDGGGSCTMLIRNTKKSLELVNHPSDNKRFNHSGARAVQSCIYLVEKAGE